MDIFNDPRGDPQSLLVVNNAGIMRRIYAPFKVLCVKPVNAISEGTQVYVEAVLSDTHANIYFLIFQQPHPHSHFRLLIKF